MRALVASTPSVGDLLVGWRLVTSFVGAMVIAVVAGRLLGVRRSWGSAAVSGLVGWVSGAILSVVLARSHEGGEAGFTRNLWLFATFFTMSATVWMEMLAKPGTLARAQGSLASVPRPIRSLRRRSRRVSRYVQVTRIAAKHGLGRSLGVPEDDGASAAGGRAPVAVRVRRALEEGGGVFVKLGQVLSTRSDLLPPAITEELARLQDRVSLADPDAVRALLEAELGEPAGSAFADFDWTPLAAASIGQVYRARLHSGDEVIVKVQRPGIAEAIERDLEVLLQLAATLEARAPWAATYRVTELANEFADRLREELDFRVEARNAVDIAAITADLEGVHVPRVHGELTTEKVLVMEWLEGTSVRQTEQLDAMGLDREKLAGTLLRCGLQQMLIHGHFHADLHPGNVMVLADGRLGLIDFGAVGRLDPLEQSSLRQLLLAVQQQDPSLLRQAVLEVGTLRRGFDDEQLERALARFMARYLGPGATPSAAMLNELLQLFFSFGISLPPEFSTFFRALVTLEGTVTTLRPGYLVIDAARAMAAEWARERLLPMAFEDLARAELIKLAPVLRRLPRHVDRLATIVERGDLTARVSLFTDDDDVKVITQLVNRGALAFLGAAVGLISVMLLGIKGGPEFTGQTSLYEFFGYFGLFCGTVLIMRVLVAILRDGFN